MVLEQDIESRACDILFEENGVPSIKLTMVTDSGWPDRIFVLPHGRILWGEFKRPGEQRSPRQVWIHRLLTAFGHEVHTFDSIELCLQTVRAAMEA